MRMDFTATVNKRGVTLHFPSHTTEYLFWDVYFPENSFSGWVITPSKNPTLVRLFRVSKADAAQLLRVSNSEREVIFKNLDRKGLVVLRNGQGGRWAMDAKTARTGLTTF